MAAPSALRAQILEPGLRRFVDRVRIPERRAAPVVDIGENSPQAFFETHLWAPIELRGDPGNVGPGAVGLAGALRDADLFAAQELHQPVDRLRLAGAEVVHATDPRTFCRREKSVGHVSHVSEIAGLRTVADDSVRPAGQLLAQENAEYRAIGARCPRARAIRVEDPDRVDRQLVDAMPVERRLLAQIFRERVRIARLDRMVFACRYAGQAVAGRGGGIDEFLHPRVPRALEHMCRALNVGRHVLEGALDGGDDVADPREVKYVASAAEQTVVG